MHPDWREFYGVSDQAQCRRNDGNVGDPSPYPSTRILKDLQDAPQIGVGFEKGQDRGAANS
jgi:hypothetical protein